MHDKDWLDEGTVFWRRGDGHFNVVPSSDYVLGMLHPEKHVSYGFDRDLMENLLYEIRESFGYDPNLYWNKSVSRMSSSDDKEMNYEVDSLSRANKKHVVTLFTMAFEYDDMHTRLMSLKNMSWIDHCGHGQNRGRLCSMPKDPCLAWNISEREWLEGLGDNGKSKIYGKVMDKHVVDVLKSLDIYPFFDERKFHNLLPKVFELIMDTPKNKPLSNKKYGWYKEGLDYSLREILEDMGFDKVVNYFRIYDIMQTIEKDLMNYINSRPVYINRKVRDLGEFDSETDIENAEEKFRDWRFNDEWGHRYESYIKQQMKN